MKQQVGIRQFQEAILVLRVVQIPLLEVVVAIEQVLVLQQLPVAAIIEQALGMLQ